jgi:hypothetical protein
LNLEFNQLSIATVHACAVGQHSGTTGLKAGINSGVVPLGAGAYEIPIRRLDELVSSRVDFLKIDVDGYELSVLEGSRAILERDQPLLFLEFHPRYVLQHQVTFTQVLTLLQEYYTQIEFWDIPEPLPLWTKVANRCWGADVVRRFDPPDMPTEQMQYGRQFGTFWILCRPSR